MLNDRWFRILSGVLVVLALGHFASLYWGLSKAFPPIDVALHFLGGAWIGGMANWLLFRRLFSGKTPSVTLTYTFAVASALGIGIGWEIFEVIISPFVVQESWYFKDTLGDLLADSIGGYIAAFLFLRLHKTSVERRG